MTWLVDEGIGIKELSRQNHKQNATRGFIDATGDMPADMYQWMSRIKVYVTRNLSNHPLHSDIQATIFHSKNRNSDFNKMMGLLEALLQDTELVDNNSSSAINEQFLHPVKLTSKAAFEKTSYDSETLLNEIMVSENPTEMLGEQFRTHTSKENEILRGLLGELSDKGYLKIQWAANLPYIIHIQNSARVHYEQDTAYERRQKEMQTQKPIVFISHCEEDKVYSDKLITLFQQMKIPDDCIFSFSSPAHAIPLGKDIYTTLKEKLDYKQKTFVLFILSSHFYGSPDCLNEMGAAWIASQQQVAILVPKFDFAQVKGVVGKSTIHMKINDKPKLNELKDMLIDFFELNDIKQNSWEKMRDDFIKEVSAYTSPLTADSNNSTKEVINSIDNDREHESPIISDKLMTIWQNALIKSESGYNKQISSIIRILPNANAKGLSAREIATEAQLSYEMAMRILNVLQETNYILKKDNLYRLNPMGGI